MEFWIRHTKKVPSFFISILRSFVTTTSSSFLFLSRRKRFLASTPDNAVSINQALCSSAVIAAACSTVVKAMFNLRSSSSAKATSCSFCAAICQLAAARVQETSVNLYTSNKLQVMSSTPNASSALHDDYSQKLVQCQETAMSLMHDEGWLCVESSREVDVFSRSNTTTTPITLMYDLEPIQLFDCKIWLS